jgi:serine/threonine protein phosphatase 1
MATPQTYVIGDIHGAYNALKQCLDKSGFNYQSDHLICLGDVCDGWPETKLCIDELLKIKNLTYILGNHDIWLLNWMTSNVAEDIWLSQGGAATVASYSEGVPPAHVQFLKKALSYFLYNNKLFVHAGIDPQIPLDKQDIMNFAWDRSLIQKAWNYYVTGTTAQLTQFEEVYIGHTPIPFPHPAKSCEIWMMDTGAGWAGVLSMMNVDTKEVFVSDRVPLLYPGVEGRMKRK